MHGINTVTAYKHLTPILARPVTTSKGRSDYSFHLDLKNYSNYSVKIKSALATALNLLRIMARLSPTLPFVASGKQRVSEGEGSAEGQNSQSKRAIALLEGYFKARSKESASISSKILTMYRLYSVMIAENLNFTVADDAAAEGVADVENDRSQKASKESFTARPVVIIFPNIFGLTGWHAGIAKLCSKLGADVLLVNYFDRADQPNPFSLLSGNDSRAKLLDKIKTVDESTIITEIFESLKALGGEKQTKVYVLGSSYGATLAMKLASSGDPRFRFLCLFYPSLFYRDGFTLIGGAEDILSQFRNIFAEIRIFIGELDGVLHPIDPKAFADASDRVVGARTFIIPDIDHAYVEPYLTRILPSYLYKPWLSWLTIIYFIIFVYDDLNYGSLN